MTRRRKVTIAMIGTCAISLTAWCVASNRHDERIRRELHGKAQAAKDDIDRRFPPGSPQFQVIDYLRQQQPTRWHSEAEDDYYVSVGKQPGGAWYCGPMDVVIIAKFHDRRLISTEIDEIGLDCFLAGR